VSLTDHEIIRAAEAHAVKTHTGEHGPLTPFGIAHCAAAAAVVLARPEHPNHEHVLRRAQLVLAAPDDGAGDALEVALTRLEGAFDPDELVQWAETYGHPEVWANRAHAAHARAERAESRLAALEAKGASA
jgi:hypothetical protein